MPPAVRHLWRQVQAQLQGAQTIHAWIDPAFYASQVGALPAGLSAAAHYLRHGWREGRQPHPLFEATFYRQACMAAGLGVPKGPPLLHYCRVGARAGVLCSPVFHATWWSNHRHARPEQQAPSLNAVHPLGALALQLLHHAPAEAATLLLRWQTDGISPGELEEIRQLKLPIQPATAIPATHRLVLLNASPLHWSSHVWWQQLPIDELQQLHALEAQTRNPSSNPPLTVVLTPHPKDQSLPIPTLLEWWEQAQGAEQVIVLDHSLATLLQTMGLPQVQCLHPSSPRNGWLNPAALVEWAEQQLGLPPPAGLPSGQPVVLGETGTSWQSSLSNQLINLPGWAHLFVNSGSQARAQAAWLQRCAQSGHQVVLLNPADAERDGPALQALQPSALTLQGNFSEASLLHEISWYAQGCPQPVLPATPQPRHSIGWDHRRTTQTAARVSVCISLHNYGHTIERALESVRAQTMAGDAIELLVVDDASTDAGPAYVQSWMNQHGRHFLRCSLLQHANNGGLAAARNTAFELAEAPWCFVLDADNLLQPTALQACWSIAEHCSEATAVVHPWIALETQESGAQRRRIGLHNVALWQRERFVHGNHIDAMALVRRSAWQSVGGYTHIPGGWEDFDFWCCLIESGWHGVCAPQVLCSYVVHQQSMLATETNNNLRSIARILQHRHPWLALNVDGLEPSGGVHRR